MALAHNQSFKTFSDSKAQLHQWALLDNFAIKIEKCDRSRCVIKCRTAADCHFHVRAIWKLEQELVVITALKAIHTTCLGAAPVPCASCSQFIYLREAVPKILALTGRPSLRKSRRRCSFIIKAVLVMLFRIRFFSTFRDKILALRGLNSG